jgi:hypothetical protein
MGSVIDVAKYDEEVGPFNSTESTGNPVVVAGPLKVQGCGVDICLPTEAGQVDPSATGTIEPKFLNFAIGFGVKWNPIASGRVNPLKR